MDKREREHMRRGLLESFEGKGTIMFKYTNSNKESKIRRVEDDTLPDEHILVDNFVFKGTDKTADSKVRAFRFDRVESYYGVEPYKKPYIVSIKRIGYWIDEYEVEAESEELAIEEYYNVGGCLINDSPLYLKEYESEIESVKPDFIEEDWDE